MKAYELTADQTRTGGCKAAELARKCGYASLDAYLAEGNRYSLDLAEVESQLQEQLEDMEAQYGRED